MIEELQSTLKSFVDELVAAREKPLLLSRKAAAALLGISVRSFDTLSRNPRFPGPVRPTGGDPYWKRRDVEQWVERTR